MMHYDLTLPLSLVSHSPYVPMVTMCGYIDFLSVTETGLIPTSRFCTYYSLCLDTLLPYLCMAGVGEKNHYSHTHSTRD